MLQTAYTLGLEPKLPLHQFKTLVKIECENGVGLIKGISTYFVASLLEMSHWGDIAESLKKGIKSIFLKDGEIPVTSYETKLVSLTTDSEHRKSMTSINLDQTSFPLYGIQSIDKELFVAGGGGGAAKTGVKNAIHIYKLNRCGNSFKADRVCEVETDNRAVMNLDVHPDKEAIAVGTDHICQIFEMKKKIEKGQAKVALTSSSKVNSSEEPAEDDEDPVYQKCVRFTPDKKHIITASSDGTCRIFKYPSLEEKSHIKAHALEIDDLDINIRSRYQVKRDVIITNKNGKYKLTGELPNDFVTVTKESSASLWRIPDGKKELELPFSLDKKDEDFYRFRNCRFSESKDLERSFLYTTHIPRKSSKEKPVNCLVKWDTRKWIPEHTVYIKNHTLSALAVSAIGRYLAVGTADGSILVYIAWNMRHLRTVSGVHEIFVTGLSFIPENKVLCEDMRQDAAILSCSIDNNCQVTLVPSRGEYPVIVVLVLFLLTIILLFNVITYFDIEF